MIEINMTYSIDYPFCRDKFIDWCEEDGDEVDTWRPGTKFVDGPDTCPEDPCTVAVADAMGKMHLSVVSIHRPGKFPTRVFFTRQWTSPDGKTFGKGNLHVTTQQAFTRLLAGYRHEYKLIS